MLVKIKCKHMIGPMLVEDSTYVGKLNHFCKLLPQQG